MKGRWRGSQEATWCDGKNEPWAGPGRGCLLAAKLCGMSRSSLASVLSSVNRWLGREASPSSEMLCLHITQSSEGMHPGRVLSWGKAQLEAPWL